jgi:putative transposase
MGSDPKRTATSFVTRLARPRQSPLGGPTVVVMPRPPRLQVAGGLYHVTAHSNVGRVVFENGAERDQFLVFLGVAVERHRWSCRSYCLLSTHYHLLVQTPQPDIAAGMQYLNGRYAQWANWLRRERSHIFEGRYWAVLVTTESHALEVHRYIALNPVRAGLVRDPVDWPWSSLPALLGRKPPPPFLDVGAALELFGPNTWVARRRLRRFIRDGLIGDKP